VLTLGAGAVATSTTARRRWRNGGTTAHHLIDPATGEPSTSGVAAVTVVAGWASTAEVVAKAALLAGVAAGIELIESWGAAGFVVDDGGTVHRAGPLEEYEP
jgi:thiamine biosynthesis lipoprotein